MKKIITLITILLTSFFIHGQDIKVDIEVPDSVQLDKHFTIKYSVNRDIKSDAVKLDSFPFKMISAPSISHMYSNIDGTIKQSTQISYVYLAEKTGILLSPRATITIDGKDYASESASILITENNIPDITQISTIYITLEVSKNRVVVGEPFTAEITLHSNLQIEKVLDYTFPDFAGFLIEREELPESILKTTTINGKKIYTATLGKYRLTPLYPGTLTIEECVFKINTLIKHQNKNNPNYFNCLFGSTSHVSKTHTLKSRPATITVTDSAARAALSNTIQHSTEAAKHPEMGSSSRWEYFIPAGLLLLMGLFFLLYMLYIKKQKDHRTVSRRCFFLFLPLGILVLLLTLLIYQSPIKKTELIAMEKLVNIQFVLDESQTMLAEDLKPNRKTAAREALKKHFKTTSCHFTGMVAFAKNCKVLSPDSNQWSILDSTNIEGIDPDGTAIGDAIALATWEQLKQPSDYNYIILLTDGDNNSGFLAPHTAAEMAAAFHIRIYIIGIGTNKKAKVPYHNPADSKQKPSYITITTTFDENLYRKITQESGGDYYRAASETELDHVFLLIEKQITEDSQKEIENRSRFTQMQAFEILKQITDKITGTEKE